MQNITTLPEKTCGSEFLQMERYTSVRGAHRVFVHYLSEHVFFVKGLYVYIVKISFEFFWKAVIIVSKEEGKVCS